MKYFIFTILAVLGSPAADSAEKPRIWLTTAYCPCVLCTGKRPGDPGHGITASGTPAVGKLAAGPRWMKLGTVIDVSGYGRVKVLDRYSKRLSDRFDLLFDSHAAAKNWGARRVRVRVERKRS